MHTKLRLATFVAAVFFGATGARPTRASTVDEANANFWFSFGDSYTQTGFDPNGTLPAPGNPLGNPAYPGNTNAGGPVWVDLDTTVYNASLVLTYNYAYGGATIDASIVPPPQGPSIRSLVDQVDEFVGGPVGPWTSGSALFSVWIGINDIGHTYDQGGDRDAFSDVLMDAYFGQVQRLFDIGARNFLFVNLPPVNRSPMMLRLSADAQALEKSVIEGYNSKLAARVASFQAAHTDVETWLWDSSAVFTAILDDPTAYGFADATSYGNADSFWGNDYHPASTAHNIFAQDVASLLSGTVW